jgi:PKD domain
MVVNARVSKLCETCLRKSALPWQFHPPASRRLWAYLRTLNSLNGDSTARQSIEGSAACAMKFRLENPTARQFVPAHTSLRLLRVLLIAVILPFFAASSHAQMPEAQMGPEAGSELNGTGPMATPGPSSSDMPAPIPNLHIPQPVRGSMMVSPPYGNAPLRVGFFVLASDPENLGFLTYSWNFGDGSVSSLPPELYIYHTYQNPGSYVCELTLTTVDGRKTTFMQGVIVEPPSH